MSHSIEKVSVLTIWGSGKVSQPHSYGSVHRKHLYESLYAFIENYAHRIETNSFTVFRRFPDKNVFIRSNLSMRSFIGAFVDGILISDSQNRNYRF